MPILAKLGSFEPACWKFFLAIGHVLSAEDAEIEHLFGGKLGRESAPEGASHRFRAKIDIALLHFVIHFHFHGLHLNSLSLRLRSVYPRRSQINRNYLQTSAEFSL